MKWNKIKYDSKLSYDLQKGNLPPLEKQVLFYKKGFYNMVSKDYYVSKMILIDGRPSIDGSCIVDGMYWAEYEEILK